MAECVCMPLPVPILSRHSTALLSAPTPVPRVLSHAPCVRPLPSQALQRRVNLRRIPDMHKLVALMAERQLLPAIWFILSRCVAAVMQFWADRRLSRRVKCWAGTSSPLPMCGPREGRSPVACDAKPPPETRCAPQLRSTPLVSDPAALKGPATRCAPGPYQEYQRP